MARLTATTPAQSPLFDQDIQEEKLIVEMDLVFQALLEEGLEDHLARAIGRVAGAAHRGLAEVPRMAAKGRWAIRPSARRLKGRPQCPT